MKKKAEKIKLLEILIKSAITEDVLVIIKNTVIHAIPAKITSLKHYFHSSPSFIIFISISTTCFLLQQQKKFNKQHLLLSVEEISISLRRCLVIVFFSKKKISSYYLLPFDGKMRNNKDFIRSLLQK